MKKTVTLGITLVLSVLVLRPGIASSLLSNNINNQAGSEVHSQVQPWVEPDPHALAILAPTATPTSQVVSPLSATSLSITDLPATDPALTEAVEVSITGSESAGESASAPLATTERVTVFVAAVETVPTDTSISMLPTVTPTPMPTASIPADSAPVPAQPANETLAVPVAEVEAPPAMAPAPTPTSPAPDVAVATVAEQDTPLSAVAGDVAIGNAVTDDIVADDNLLVGCTVMNPPASLGLDPFYTKYCAAYGIPIVASGDVPDHALHHAWATLTYMLDGLPQFEEIRANMLSRKLRVGIIGTNQLTTEMPEHRNLYALFSGIDWNSRTRAIGATPQMPLLSVSEENLLCYSNNQWVGQNLLVHEFAHAIKNFGLDFINLNVHAELLRAHQNAQEAGLWNSSYVVSDVEEYWAEGVRIYFQTHLTEISPNGLPYPANTRAELQTYDPELYRIVQSIFGSKDGLSNCP